MITVRILIADDHEIVRHGLRVLLERQPGWVVVDEAIHGREAVEKVEQYKPDVVVMDISMPELNGLDATRQILRIAPETEVVILTEHESEQVVKDALEAGARGYVLKSDPGLVVVTAVDALRSVADHAEDTGDHRLGLLAVERLVVITHRRQDVAGLVDAFTRAHRLAAQDDDRAAALVVLGDALLAEAAGDATRVLDTLDRLHPDQLDEYWRAPITWMRAQALLALGHPEAALAHSTLAVESAPPGQTALFNQWEDAVECARCGGRMVRTGSCYTCRDCGTNTGCS